MNLKTTAGVKKPLSISLCFALISCQNKVEEKLPKNTESEIIDSFSANFVSFKVVGSEAVVVIDVSNNLDSDAFVQLFEDRYERAKFEDGEGNLYVPSSFSRFQKFDRITMKWVISKGSMTDEIRWEFVNSVPSEELLSVRLLCDTLLAVPERDWSKRMLLTSDYFTVPRRLLTKIEGGRWGTEPFFRAQLEKVTGQNRRDCKCEGPFCECVK